MERAKEREQRSQKESKNAQHDEVRNASTQAGRPCRAYRARKRRDAGRFRRRAGVGRVSILTTSLRLPVCHRRREANTKIGTGRDESREATGSAAQATRLRTDAEYQASLLISSPRRTQAPDVAFPLDKSEAVPNTKVEQQPTAELKTLGDTKMGAEAMSLAKVTRSP